MVLSKAITKAVTNPEGCSPLERNEEQENVLGKLNGITEGRALLWPGNGVDINRAWFMPLVTAGTTMDHGALEKGTSWKPWEYFCDAHDQTYTYTGHKI